jgi:hypothetical protein
MEQDARPEASEAAAAPEASEPPPLAALEVLAVQEAAITDALTHVELFTLRGLLTVLWHGPRDASQVVLACGGAMGGLLGPADGLYHDLGTSFADRGIATLRVGWRKPNDLERCTHDLVAAADLAFRSGGRRFVTIGHSFGGAIALRAGIMLGDQCRGVVTLSTQSAGCEVADQLPPTPLLLFHGDRDELLPVAASRAVQQLAGGEGELVVLPATGHLLTEAGAVLRGRLSTWIPDRLAEEAP